MPLSRLTVPIRAAVAVALVAVLLADIGAAQDDPAPQTPGQPTASFQRPFQVPIEGVIDRWNLETFKRRTADALAAGADLIVVPIDTPGGELQAAFDFGNHVFNELRPKARVVFYIKNQAFSAGALIALSGHEIVMGPGGTIGDCQPIFMVADGIKEGPEKIQSPIRAVFRKYAEANHYPVALAESMVSKQLAVLRLTLEDGSTVYLRADDYESWTDEEKNRVKARKTVVKEGELLTMTASEALAFGFARTIVKSEEELGRLYGIDGFAPAVLEPTWSEEMVRQVQAWNFLFILIGLLCLYLEFKTPGFGFFGGVGVIAFGVYFFFGYMTGLSNYWEIALCLVGLALIGVEIFVLPGFGVAGVLGLGCLMVGLFAGGIPDEFIVPTMPYQQEIFEAALLRFSGTVAAVIVLAIVITRFLPDIPVFNRLILKTAVATPHAEAVPGRAARRTELVVGAGGTALTPLRPTGTARVGGTRVDVVTRGEFIDRGAALRVIRTTGNRIVVTEVADAEEQA